VNLPPPLPPRKFGKQTFGPEGNVVSCDVCHDGYMECESYNGRDNCTFKDKEIAPAFDLEVVEARPTGGHPEYIKLLREMERLHCKKAADYGRGEDPFANVRAGSEWGVPAWVGVMIRACDKVHRLKSFVANGVLKNESVEDSLMDLAAYAMIALVLYREDREAAREAGLEG
jgi:hypothetical protein